MLSVIMIIKRVLIFSRNMQSIFFIISNNAHETRHSAGIHLQNIFCIAEYISLPGNMLPIMLFPIFFFAQTRFFCADMFYVFRNVNVIMVDMSPPNFMVQVERSDWVETVGPSVIWPTPHSQISSDSYFVSKALIKELFYQLSYFKNMKSRKLKGYDFILF